MVRPKRQPRVPKRATSQETRNALLDTTEKVLRAEGIVAVTTTHVAREAGVSVGTVYEYFPSKEHLVLALEERSWLEVTERIMQTAPSLVQERPPREAGEALISYCITVLRERIELHGFSRDTPETAETRHANVAKMARYLLAFFGALGLTPIVPDPQFTLELSVGVVINATRLGTLYHGARLDDGSFQRELSQMIIGHVFGPPT